jgi:radical SAM protein with 4Fe4S-binding SPASM domain
MSIEAPAPKRYVTEEDLLGCKPVYAVWEITLKCDLKCNHCGSRAGRARPSELSTDECFDVVRQLAELGTRSITLIGGEAYLRKDWTDIVRCIRDHGMEPTLTTGGRNLTEERVEAAAKAGLRAASVSIDGLEETHDAIRGVKGSWKAAFAALERLRRHGVLINANTQITRQSMPQLPELMELLLAAGVKNWQLQLTVAMGNAADHPELLLQPYHLAELMPMLARLHGEALARGMLLQPGNNIGYFGPYERLWRGDSFGEGHWVGCNAGQNTIGLEADGTNQGCPSLPTTDYTGGNIRDLSIREMWMKSPEISFTRDRTVNDLWGHCRTCYYADVCRAGCTWTTHVLFGKPGNNPYCHHRVLELKKRGLRERIVKVAAAPGKPFDYGGFELREESTDTPAPEDERIAWRKPASKAEVSTATGLTQEAAS